MTDSGLSTGIGIGILLGVAGSLLVSYLRNRNNGEAVTADTINSLGGATGNNLIDSLRGIREPGATADLLKVRVLGIERAKLVAMRGTKGVKGDEPTVFVRFADMTTEHLENTRSNGRNLNDDEYRIIDSILEDRNADLSTDPEDEDEEEDPIFER